MKLPLSADLSVSHHMWDLFYYSVLIFKIPLIFLIYEYLEEYLIISKHMVFKVHLFVIGLKFNYAVVREFSRFHKNSLKWIFLLNGLLQGQFSYVSWVLKKNTFDLKFSLKKSLLKVELTHFYLLQC